MGIIALAPLGKIYAITLNEINPTPYTFEEIEEITSENFNPRRVKFFWRLTKDIKKEFNILSPALKIGAFVEERSAIERITSTLKQISMIHNKSGTGSAFPIPHYVKNSLIFKFEILKMTDHPNIMKTFSYCVDQEYLYLIKESCSQGELFDRIINHQHLGEKISARIFHQILSIVASLHDQGIVHRDIKPDNIFFLSNEGQKGGNIVKLTDFSTSNFLAEGEKFQTVIGTPYYIAPEVLDRDYDHNCDLWSCGVILYIMLSGIPPFNGDDDDEILNKVQIGKWEFNKEKFENISGEAKDLIKGLLEKDPRRRLGAREAMKHSWFTKFLEEKVNEDKNIQNHLNNLRGIKFESKLQEFFFLYIVEKLLQKEHVIDATLTYQSLDVNRDGRVSKKEIFDAFGEISSEEFNSVMGYLDPEETGYVIYSKFLSYSVDRELFLQKKVFLRNAFRIFDEDNDQKISVKDLSNVFGALSLSKDSWEMLIQEALGEERIEIEFQDFQNVIEKLKPKYE